MEPLIQRLDRSIAADLKLEAVPFFLTINLQLEGRFALLSKAVQNIFSDGLQQHKGAQNGPVAGGDGEGKLQSVPHPGLLDP